MNFDKKQAILLISSIVAASLLSLPYIDTENALTGSFTEAKGNLVDQQQTSIEEVYWKFEDGTTAKGNFVERNLTHGAHNVTIKTVKSNGETETYHKTVVID